MNKHSWIAAAFVFALACRAAPEQLLHGHDFAGWRVPMGTDAAHWRFVDGNLEAEGPAGPIWTEADFADCVIDLDVRSLERQPTAVLFARGARGFQVALEPGREWTHVHASFHGDTNDVEVDGMPSAGVLAGVAERGPIGLGVEGLGRVEFARISVRKLR